MPYTPPSWNAANFDLATYTPPSGNAAHFTFSSTVLLALSEVVTLASGSYKQTNRTLSQQIAIVSSKISNIGIAFGEIISVQSGAFKAFARSILEHISIVASSTYLQPIQLILSEAITITSNASKSASKVVSEVVSIAWGAIKRAYKVISNAISIVSSLQVAQTLHRTYTEVISTVDSVAKSTSRILSKETITIVSNLTRGFFQSLSEILSIVGSMGNRNIFKVIAQPIKIVSKARALLNGITAWLWGNVSKSVDDTWTRTSKSVTDSWNRVSKSVSDAWTRTPKD